VSDHGNGACASSSSANADVQQHTAGKAGATHTPSVVK
jgi:hypothetical protein